MSIERTAAIAAILVACGSALMQCNDLGEFKGITRTQIQSLERDVAIAKDSGQSTRLGDRIQALELNVAVLTEQIKQLSWQLQQEKRR